MPSGRKNVTSVTCLHKEEAFWITRYSEAENVTIKQARIPMNATFEGFPEDFHFHWN